MAEKEEEFFKRVAALNLSLEYDGGFSIVARSASAEQRDDDADAVIEQMGQYVKQISSLAAGKARSSAHGNDFLGEQVYVPDRNGFIPAGIFGRLRSVGQDGDVTVAYRQESFKVPGEVIDSVHSCSGADLLLILNDDGPAPASDASFSWIVDERLRRLFVRAAEAGLRLEHFSGFTLVKWRVADGVEPEVVEKIVKELGVKLREISALTAARARGESGSRFIGRRVLVPPLSNVFGTIVSSDANGKVTVRYRDKHMESEYTSWCDGSQLLIVPDEDPAKPASAEQDSEESGWRKFVRRVFGG